MAVVIGMAVPVANIFAVSALSRGGNIGFGAAFRRVVLTVMSIRCSLSRAPRRHASAAANTMASKPSKIARRRPSAFSASTYWFFA